MINLLMPRNAARASAARTFLARAAERLGGVVAEFRAPAALARPVAAVEPVADDTDVPALAEIEAAAEAYAAAADQARAADRGKRKARKVLDLVPAGTWGGWLVERVASGRQTVDLEAVRATYARLGLGDVPMKDAAPSLKVSRAVDTTAAPVPAEAELLTLAGAR